MSAPSIVWFRDDLRLGDNPALRAATDSGAPTVAVYLLDEESDGIRPLGSATRWWLHHSLLALAEALESRGGRLVLRRAAAERAIPALVRETGATAVNWNRRYGPGREVDARIETALRSQGIEVATFTGSLLFEPGTVTTEQGEPYRVFTPFWNAARRHTVRDALPAPERVPAPAEPIPSDDLTDWALLPTRPDWAAVLRSTWTPGERGAHARLEKFAVERLARYHRRDEPAADATSMLSPHLRFGEVSPAQVWARVHGDVSPAARRNLPKFLSELGWREFNWNTLSDFPHLATQNARAAFDAFPWELDRGDEVEAWQRGRTGIPLVDAGMRELWATGYQHNRVRMVAASLLVKNLLCHWRIGEAWFWDTLVDADEANNPANWQWVAGSGADAPPYFRIFNPEVQAAKLDPDQVYIRRWVPELGTASYPQPIVDLAESRRDALAAYEHVKNAGR